MKCVNKKRNCKWCGKEFEVNLHNKFVCPKEECKFQSTGGQLGKYEKNKEYILKYSREYYQKNRERQLELNKKWKEDNKEDWQKYQKKYFENNKPRFNKLMNEQYYRNKEIHFIRIYTNMQRGKIIKIIGNKCKVCENKKIEIHHEKYFKIPQTKKPFNDKLKKKIKKYLFPYCTKHHREYHKKNKTTI